MFIYTYNQTTFRTTTTSTTLANAVTWEKNYKDQNTKHHNKYSEWEEQYK